MKIPSNKEEWIEYVVEAKAVPIWSEEIEGKVCFRRLTKIDEYAGKHIFGKKRRQFVAEMLGIFSKEDCERIREIIKQRIL